MCGARAAFAHLNLLLAVVGGAALVACAIVIPSDLITQAENVPSASTILYTPYIAGPLLLVLSHLGMAALQAAPRNARVALVVYAAISVVTALVGGALAGWSVSQIVNWLRDEASSAPYLRASSTLRLWMQPFQSLAADTTVKVLSEEGVHADVVGVLAVCSLTLLLLLVNAALAVAARPRRVRDDEHALRPCSSLYYEPSAPAYKPPMHDPEAWQ